MIEPLLVAGLTGLVAGALMIGMLRGEVRLNTAAIAAVHARLDAFATALNSAGTIKRGAREDISRCREMQVKMDRRRRR